MLHALILTAVTATTDDPCVTLGNTAYMIMDMRQRGVPMSELMGISDESDLLRAMIVDAYNLPRMSAEQNRIEVSEDFRTAIELMCYEVMHP